MTNSHSPPSAELYQLLEQYDTAGSVGQLDEAERKMRNQNRAAWLAARGVRVVPDEPTEEMIEAAQAYSGWARVHVIGTLRAALRART